MEPNRSEGAKARQKDSVEFFHVRALKDSLYIHLDGKYYIMQIGDVLKVEKTMGNIKSFGNDIKREKFEIISEKAYEKLASRKSPQEQIVDNVTVEEFEKMLEEAK